MMIFPIFISIFICKLLLMGVDPEKELSPWRLKGITLVVRKILAACFKF